MNALPAGPSSKPNASPDMRLGFGAANLGNLRTAMTDEIAKAILTEAWDGGIRYFDTAPHYGLGLSERRLGAFLRTKPRDEFLISTKVGRLLRPRPEWDGEQDDEGFDVPGSMGRVVDFSEAGIRASHAESLERLELDRVDILYLHDPERTDIDAGLKHAIPALQAMREEGIVSAIGVGSMSVSALRASADTAGVDLLMVAGRLTLAEQPLVPEVIDRCRERGIGIVNASVLNSGLLASDDPSADSRYDYGEVPAELLERVARIRSVCHRFGVPLPTAALHYASGLDVVRSVVLAGSKPGQIGQSLRRLRGAVPKELWSALIKDHLVDIGPNK